MRFPTEQEFAERVAEKVMDEYMVDGKTLREWINEGMDIRADRDYWKAEALKWCGKLGEIRMLAEGGASDEC